MRSLSLRHSTLSQPQENQHALALTLAALFSTLIALGMSLGCAQTAHADTVTASSATELQHAIEGASGQRTITITNDIALTKTLELPANTNATVTIVDDGSAHTITAPGLTSMFSVPKGAQLEFATSAQNNALLVFSGTGMAANTGGKGAIVDCSGVFTLSGGTLTGVTIAASASETSSAVRISGTDAKFDMTGGIVSDCTINNQFGAAIYVAECATFNMSGGEVTKITGDIGVYYTSAIHIVAAQGANTTFNLSDNASIHNNSVGYGTVFVGSVDDPSGDLKVAQMNMSNDAQISNNTAAWGGGGVAVWGAGAFVMTGGAIDSNVVGSSIDGQLVGGNGGGVSVIESKSSVEGHGDHASFHLDGGSITKNESTGGGYGGGIYVASKNVHLESGEIARNKATGGLGGGIYVSNNSYGTAAEQFEVKLGATAITKNQASIIGGGIWLCPTGTITLNENNGAALFDNTAEGAADDLASVPKDTAYAGSDSLQLGNVMPGGSLTHWYTDGAITKSPNVSVDEDHANLGTPVSTADRYHEAASELDISEGFSTNEYVSVKSVPSEEAKESAIKSVGLVISENSAGRGGGIAGNAHLVFGTKATTTDVVSIQVNKEWVDNNDEAEMRPQSIEVGLYLTNAPGGVERQVTTATIYAANEWKYTFMNLPKYLNQYGDTTSGDECKYEVREINTPPAYAESSQVTGEGDAGKTVTITNTKRSLAISKTVEAEDGVTPPDADFTFRVTLSDKDGKKLDDTYKYCKIDAAGNTVRNENGEVVWSDITSGGTLSLKAGERAVIVALPKDAKYSVTEGDTLGFPIKDEAKKTQTGSVADGETVTASFVNMFTPKAVTDTISLTKTVTDSEANSDRGWKDGATFQFELTAETAGAPMPDSSIITVGKAAGANTNTSSFGSITFTKEGTYVYRVGEVVPSASADRDSDMYYSRAIYNVTFEVTFNGETGGLDVARTIKRLINDSGFAEETEAEGVTFTNTYYAVDEAVVGLNGRKNYTDTTGSNPIHDGMFTFRITPTNDNAKNGPMPEVPLENIGTSEDGNWYYKVSNVGEEFGFGNVTYTWDPEWGDEPQEFTYTVQEVIPKDAVYDLATQTAKYNGITYDTHSCSVTVTVTKEVKDSVVEVSASLAYKDHYDGHVHPNYFTFDNSYTAAPTTTSLSATKNLAGRDWTDGDAFTFDLRAVTAGAPMPSSEDTTATATSATPVSFGDITYTTAGVYEYAISERLLEGAVDDDPNTDGFQHKGVTYDQTVHKAIVTVTDNTEGQLVASVSYDGSESESATFTNTYTAHHAVVAFEGVKELTGRSWQAGDVFEFKLEAGDTATQTAVDAGSIEMPITNAIVTPESLSVSEGRYVFDFAPIKITQAGTYTFKVYEALPADDSDAAGVQSNGVTYDQHVYKMKVVVTDDNEGTFAVEYIDETEGSMENSSLFTNAYADEHATKASLSVTKVLTGRDWADNDEFSFTLSPVTADAPMPSSDSTTATVVATAATQTATFGAINYEAEGEYNYEIREVLPADDNSSADGVQASGVTYDEAVCAVKVTVSKADDGKLSAAVTYNNAEDESAMFTNTYEKSKEVFDEPTGTTNKDNTSNKDDASEKGTTSSTGDRIGLLFAAIGCLALAGVIALLVVAIRSRHRE